MKKSVLIRGAISFDKRPTSFVSKTIPIIRSWFDGELVISTWKGQEQYLKGIEKHIDKVILSEDPGPGFIQAYNRQLISYQKGLEECSGDIVFVARSDFNITKDPFILWKNVTNINNNYMKVFDKRVIVGNMMTVHPKKEKPSDAFFRVSDWIQMGQKSDLMKWASVLETSKSLYKQIKNIENINTNEYKSDVYGSEQVWLISLLHKYLGNNINLLNYESFCLDDVWAAIINNFWVMNTRSTLNAYNLNWDFQPEFHPIYMTEDEYLEAFMKLYGNKL